MHVLLVFPVTPSAQFGIEVHDELPADALYPVCGHSAHAFVPSLYDPAAHCVHSPFDNPYPALHLVHVFPVFPVTPSMQLGNAEHDELPAAVLYASCAQTAHAALPALYDPAAHCVHAPPDNP